MSAVLQRHNVETSHAWPIIHPTADVAPSAQIGAGTKIWHRVHVREYASIGAHCVIGKDVYIDADVHIGNNVKIQNSALIYHGAQVEDGVFIGPQACLTNDVFPRAINPDGSLKDVDDWAVGETLICYGASLGAGAIVVAGVTIGRFAMVGAGAVVTHDVPPYGLVVGVPARLVGFVCPCGHRLVVENQIGRCPTCGATICLEGSIA